MCVHGFFTCTHIQTTENRGHACISFMIEAVTRQLSLRSCNLARRNIFQISHPWILLCSYLSIKIARPRGCLCCLTDLYMRFTCLWTSLFFMHILHRCVNSAGPAQSLLERGVAEGRGTQDTHVNRLAVGAP